MHITDLGTEDVVLIDIDELSRITGMSKKYITGNRRKGLVPGTVRMGSQTYKYDKKKVMRQLSMGQFLLSK